MNSLALWVQPPAASRLARWLAQPADREAWRRLSALRDVGPAIAMDLVRLGVRDEATLRAASPADLSERLGHLDGSGPRGLEAFEAAVLAARGARAKRRRPVSPV